MDDFWDLTVEEMDAIENEALQRINQQRNSSSSSSLPIPNEVHTSSQGARILPSTLAPKPNTDAGSKPQEQKVSVKILLHSSGVLAAKFPYNQVVVDAVRKIPKAIWNAKERLWTFPHSSLSSAENILREISSVKVEVSHIDSLKLLQKVQLKLGQAFLRYICYTFCPLNYQIENLDPLVQRAIASASRVPDLRHLYEKIPSHIEPKLLPFQREGIEYVSHM
jgi:SWI/SNF-related matrix-associated actin-dependent regulator 1 of chromatin subfamily A